MPCNIIVSINKMKRHMTKLRHLRVRVDIIGRARIRQVGKCQSRMVENGRFIPHASYLVSRRPFGHRQGVGLLRLPPLLRRVCVRLNRLLSLHLGLLPSRAGLLCLHIIIGTLETMHDCDLPTLYMRALPISCSARCWASCASSRSFAAVRAASSETASEAFAAS